MNPNPTKEHLDAYVAHAVSNLPDSLHLRKTILVTLLSTLPKNYEGRQGIRLLLESLRTHEQAQLEFTL